MCDKSQDDRLQLQLNIMLRARKFTSAFVALNAVDASWKNRYGQITDYTNQQEKRMYNLHVNIKYGSFHFTVIEINFKVFSRAKQVNAALLIKLYFQWTRHNFYCPALHTELHKIMENVLFTIHSIHFPQKQPFPP